MTIDLCELEQELQRMSNSVQLWAEAKQDEALDTRDRHIMTMEDQAAKVQGMRGKHQQLQGLAAQVMQRLESEQQEKTGLEGAERDVKAQSLALRSQVEQLQRELKTVCEEQLHKDADYALEESLRSKKIQALRSALSVYATRLGLHLMHGADELELAFTHIDPSAPHRRFHFSVCVQPDSSYQVMRCEPSVADMSMLMQRLNTSGDFAEFVKGLRVAFQALVASEQGPLPRLS